MKVSTGATHLMAYECDIIGDIISDDVASHAASQTLDAALTMSEEGAGGLVVDNGSGMRHGGGCGAPRPRHSRREGSITLADTPVSREAKTRYLTTSTTFPFSHNPMPSESLPLPRLTPSTSLLSVSSPSTYATLLLYLGHSCYLTIQNTCRGKRPVVQHGPRRQQPHGGAESRRQSVHLPHCRVIQACSIVPFR
ncbi:hypothetical protein O3P69_007777 [Scylla paramamosain]|uniref:Uncharacterized protein n=1 Tax=Scylla paramamosain TaxID=85552 RepID=A0AAW0SGZ9_SCYPA